MFLRLSKNSIRKQIDAAPGKKIAFPELLEMFGYGQRVELLALLYRMREDYPPIWFKSGWIVDTEIVVTTVRPGESGQCGKLKKAGRKVKKRSPG